MSSFLEYFEAEVIEESRRPTHPIFDPVGHPPKNFDEILAGIKKDKKTGNPKVRPFVQAMLPLGYGDIDELMRLGNFLPKDARYVREYVKLYGDTYRAPEGVLASGDPMPDDEGAGESASTGVETDIPASADSSKDAGGNDVPQPDEDESGEEDKTPMGTKSNPDPVEPPTTEDVPADNPPASATAQKATQPLPTPDPDGADGDGSSPYRSDSTDVPEMDATKTAGREKLLTVDKMAMYVSKMQAKQKMMNKGGKREKVPKAMSRKVKEVISKKGSVGKGFWQRMYTVLAHGINRKLASKKYDLLLTGDPGVGKTTFIRQFSQLTGVPLAVIEAPHISQEHLINIPFIVATDVGNEKSGSMEFSKEGRKDYDIVSAESNLVTMIRNTKAKKNNEQAWHRKMNKMQRLKKKYDEDENLRQMVDWFRGQYDAILFIDEYFRTEDKTIRNILRGVLNGNIGTDKIPPRTYLIFASNMDNKDDSFEAPPQNTEFEPMSFDASTKADWKEWYLSRYVDDRQNAISRLEDGDYDPEDKEYYEKLASLPDTDGDLVGKIVDALPENLFSTDDDASGVRLSPRRFEQISSGLNALMRMLENGDGRIEVTPEMLFSFIRTNLRHYATGEVYQEAYDALAGLIESELNAKGITANKNKWIPSSQWRDEIRMQFAMKLALGDSRQYPFLIGGEPGVGKTMFAGSVAREFGMPMITVDASTISKDDVLGVPLPEDQDVSDEDPALVAKSKRVKFSQPPLFQRIMAEYKANRVAENKRLKDIGEPALEDGTEFHQVLFIDEFTRVDDKAVYNSLRKVMLEKSFGGKYVLPSDIIMMGALNPRDTGDNVVDLTDHMRDVLDVVDATPSWTNFYDKYLHPKLVSGFTQITDDDTQIQIPGASAYQELVGFDIVDAICKGLTAIISEIKAPEDPEGNPLDIDTQYFFWGASDDTVSVYFNPRGIEEFYKNVINDSIEALIDPSTILGGESDPDLTWDVSATYSDEYKNMWKDVMGSVALLVVNSMIDMEAHKNPDVDKEVMNLAWASRLGDPKGLYQIQFESMFLGQSQIVIPYDQMMIESDFDITQVNDSMWEALFSQPDTGPTISHFADVFLKLYKKVIGEGGTHLDFLKQINEIVAITIAKANAYETSGTFEDRLLSQLSIKFKDVGPDMIADDDFIMAVATDNNAMAVAKQALELVGEKRIKIKN